MPDPTATQGGRPYRRTRVFISYRRDGNAGDAERLYDELKRYFSASRLFLDVKSIRTGDSFPLAIGTALASCGALLVVVGPRWLGAADERGRRRLDDPSDMVRRELSAALAKGTWVVPVLTHGASMPEAKDLPEDIRRLAECQAVEIRSGHWERDVRELFALLKRRLHRRRRLLTAAASASALAAVAALSYYLATVTLPVDLRPDAPPDAPRPLARFQAGGESGQAAQGAEAPQEMLVEGLAAGELLGFDGKPLTDIRVDFDAARFDEETVERLDLNPEWGKNWEPVAYAGVSDDPAAGKDFEQACPTSLTVAAADPSTAPLSLRFFQESPPEPEGYREISLRADRDLAVNLDLSASEQPERGAGCSKRFRFGREKSVYKVGYGAAFLARADAPLALRFMPMDQNRTSPRADLLRLGGKDSFDLRTPSLRASRVVVRARGAEEIPCGDKLGRPPATSFEARSADGRSSLLIHRLEVGADYFSLAAEGDAYVVSKCAPVSPGVTERVATHLPLTALLLASAALALTCLAYSLARL